MRNASKLLECTTAHMTSRDAELLGSYRDRRGMPLRVAYMDVGFIVRVWSFGSREIDPTAALRERGFSDPFIAFLSWAQRKGFDTVLFDPDAEPAAGQPTFNW